MNMVIVVVLLHTTIHISHFAFLCSLTSFSTELHISCFSNIMSSCRVCVMTLSDSDLKFSQNIMRKFENVTNLSREWTFFRWKHYVNDKFLHVIKNLLILRPANRFVELFCDRWMSSRGDCLKLSYRICVL